MKKIILAGLVSALAVGCGKQIPSVDDPNNIVVAGESMTQQAFVEKYCNDQTQHETCVKVRRAMVAGSTRSKSGVARF